MQQGQWGPFSAEEEAQFFNRAKEIVAGMFS
jgi:hypothetical protein